MTLKLYLMFRQVDHRAIEQSEDAHTAYVFHMSFEYHPKQLVFVDKVLVITDSLEGMVTQQEDAV